MFIHLRLHTEFSVVDSTNRIDEVIKAAAKDGQPAPVILDDALVYSDDDRIERMFDALHRQASGQQIIVFSCRVSP